MQTKHTCQLQYSVVLLITYNICLICRTHRLCISAPTLLCNWRAHLYHTAQVELSVKILDQGHQNGGLLLKDTARWICIVPIID